MEDVLRKEAPLLLCAHPLSSRSSFRPPPTPRPPRYKMITFLSYVPSFAVLTDTLVTAAPEILGFAFIFFVIFFGFAQAHTMVMQAKVGGVRPAEQPLAPWATPTPNNHH